MERGSRLDLYPKDVRSIPVPRVWSENPRLSLAEAWKLSPEQEDRLMAFILE